MSSNLQPGDQELHVPLTEPVRHPSHYKFLKDLLTNDILTIVKQNKTKLSETEPNYQRRMFKTVKFLSRLSKSENMD